MKEFWSLLLGVQLRYLVPCTRAGHKRIGKVEGCPGVIAQC